MKQHKRRTHPRIHPNKKPDRRKYLIRLGNSGRHDWTRTNDPYHVKVVL
jgi:hypothetical protein